MWWGGCRPAERSAQAGDTPPAEKDRGRYEWLIAGQDVRAGFLIVDEGWIVYQSTQGHLMAYRQGQRYGVAKSGTYDTSKVYCEPHRIILQGRDRSVWAWYPPGR